MMQTMEEKEYRILVDKTFRSIERAFDRIDPDIVEFEMAQGAVTLQFANKTRCILSTQPSVRQIWLAAASKGIAFHFNYDSTKNKWLDDKGKGVELTSFVKGLVLETAGIELNL